MERNAEGRLRTTEWEDIQYKHGNKVGKYATHELELLTQRFDDAHPDLLLTSYNPKQEKYEERYERQHDGVINSKSHNTFNSNNWVDRRNNDECNNVVNQHSGESHNCEELQYEEEEEENILASYRSKRLRELQELHTQQASLGLLRHIDAQGYIDEITNASKQYWVVAILIKPGESKCEALLSILRNVAQRQCSVKFVSVVANEAVPTLPERVLPCVLLYHNGSPQHQLQGLEPWLDSIKQLNVQHAQQVLQHYKVLPTASEGCSDTCDNDSIRKDEG